MGTVAAPFIPSGGVFGYLGDSGNVSRYFLGPLTMAAAVGGSVSIRVNGCILHDGGLDWQDSAGNTVAPNFTFINGGSLSSATFGIVRPPWAPYELTALTLGLANRTRYYRVTESGPVTKVRVYIGTSSGNMCVSVHRNTGAGLAAAPGTRIGTSGSIPTPAAGQNDISLGTTVAVNAGDWIGIGADNNVVTFLGLAGGGVFGEGMAAVQNAFPAPLTPGVGYATDVLITFVGVP